MNVIRGGVVTVSRLYGAGGIRAAEAVAEATGYRLVDRELVGKAARRLGMDSSMAEGLDERALGLMEEAGLVLALAEPGAQLPPLEDRALADAVRKVIESLARRGGYVILGRGGQAALRGHPRACHLQLVGELEDRARRVAEWQGTSVEEARDRCFRTDADRAGYVRRFYDVDIMDPLLYDAVLNTSLLGIEGAVAVALAVVSDRLASS